MVEFSLPGMENILTIAQKKDEKILRQKVVPLDFNAHTKKEIVELVKNMRQTMIHANGIGLAANQIGLNYSIFVARAPEKNGHMKFYAVFNPKLERVSAQNRGLSEGCLSVPGVFGEVDRSLKVTLTGFDKLGKPLKIKAWGLLAHIFQHEVDHLNGTLFIDKAKKIYDLETHVNAKAYLAENSK